MAKIRFSEGIKALPLLAPIAFTTAVVNSTYVNFDNVQWATFLVSFGAMTSDSTDNVQVTVQCSTADSSNATEVGVAFKYRLSAVPGTLTMGDITQATATGANVTALAGDSNKMLIIDVDPVDVQALGATFRYARVVLTPSADVNTGVASVVACLEPRYPGNSYTSST